MKGAGAGWVMTGLRGGFRATTRMGVKPSLPGRHATAQE